MTGLGKAFVVFIAASSIAFMTFAFMQFWWWGAFPNYEAKARELDDYSFTYTPGESPTWTAETHRKEAIGTSPLLAKVLADAYTHKAGKIQEELTAVQARVPVLQEEITKYETAIKQDDAGIAARQKAILKELSDLQQSIEEASTEGTAKTVEAEQTRQVAELRREDIFRLKEQLDEITTERQRVEELQKQVRDLIIRVKGNKLRLLKRNQQLKSQTG